VRPLRRANLLCGPDLRRVLRWRSTSLLFVPFGMALVVACGGSNDSSGGDAGGPSDAAAAPLGDSGVTCNSQVCAPSEVCCYGSFQPACTKANACNGAMLACTSNSACGSGQTCCFTYADGGAGILGAAAFTATCQASCPDTSYELCTTTADCDNGGTCVAGPYAGYCATFDGSGFNFPDGGFFPPRREASAPAPGDDGAAGEAAGDGSSE
jgi:hypothetical protein